MNRGAGNNADCDGVFGCDYRHSGPVLPLAGVATLNAGALVGKLTGLLVVVIPDRQLLGNKAVSRARLQASNEDLSMTGARVTPKDATTKGSDLVTIGGDAWPARCEVALHANSGCGCRFPTPRIGEVGPWWFGTFKRILKVRWLND